ncbi:glutathione peroxidase [Aureococcus anophagefferens]|nr:glutathione peroxidase [Aureococcus anophagefferens]
MVELHDELGNEGLEILAFPCNQFGNQEPATCEVVAEFAKSTYGADFTMMEKVAVHGPRAHPVYNFLRATTGATPSWNFGVYFVVSRSGEVKAYRTFRAHLDLSSFPFDSQALQVDVNMGVDRATSHRLICADGWRFDQHPAAANMLLHQAVHQVNAEYHIRPLRYYVMRTSALEDARPCSKYILVIPVQRRTRYYLVSLFPTMLATVLVSFVQFEVEHEAIEPRLMVPLTLVFVLIGYKFTINDSLPNLSYMTQLDVYVQFALFHLYYLVAAEGLCFAAVRRGVVATLKRAHHMAWYVAVAYVVAFHLYYVVSTRASMRSSAKALASMGVIDETLMDHLLANGVRFNKDGVVENPARYEAKLAHEFSASHGDPDASSLMAARTRYTKKSEMSAAGPNAIASSITSSVSRVRKQFHAKLSSSFSSNEPSVRRP